MNEKSVVTLRRTLDTKDGTCHCAQCQKTDAIPVELA